MSDACETVNGFNPNDPTDADLDADHDELTNGDECALGTNPRVADTDGDGFSDGIEVQQGYNPLDPNSHPPGGGPQVVSLRVTPGSLGLSLNDLIPQVPTPLTVTGVLSDTTTIDLTHNPGTTYQSLNPAVAVVDSQGTVAPLTPGSTTIRVRNAGLTADALVAVSRFAGGIQGTLPLPGYANNVDLSGNYAYVACGLAGLQVVEVSNPYLPRIVGAVALPGNANDVRVVGNFAYVAAGSGGLQVVNVTIPTAPVVVGGVPFNGAVDVVVSGGLAYVASGQGGLTVVDVQVSGSPVLVGTLAFDGTSEITGVAFDPGRKLAVLADRNASLVRVVDVTNPATPTALGSVFVSSATDVTLAGTLAYVVNPNGLRVVNLADPANPQVVGADDLNFIGLDVEVLNGTAFAAVYDSGRPSPAFTGCFSLLNPVQPHYTGGLSSGPYSHCVGVAVTDRVAAFTTSRSGKRNEASGDTILVVEKYREDDTDGLAPVVSLTAPLTGATLVAGETVLVAAAATDDGRVAGVEFKANGTVIGNPSSPPYQVSYPIPLNAGPSLQFDARAIDSAGNVGNAAPVVVTVTTDPQTTVTGMAVDGAGNGISGATVTLQGTNRNTVTDAQGVFSLAGVGTVPLGVLVSVTVQDPAGNRQGQSASVPTVRGGVTDVGTIRLARVTSTPLPALLSALGVGPILGAGRDDLFIGFSDRASKVYAAGANGQFAESGSYSLPFGAVRSGTGIGLDIGGTFDLLAQPVGQNGNLTAVFSNGTGGVSSSSPLATGLAGESEITAAGEDFPHMVGSRPVVVTARVTGGTTLTVRIGDGNGNLLNPITLPVSPSIPLRAIQVVDVTGDQLADIVGIEEVNAEEVRFFVLPRTGATTFGPLVDSVITTRSLTASFGTVDYALGDYDQSGAVDMAVLGNDRVRIYSGNGQGRFTPVQEIPLPAGTSALGIAQLQDTGGNRLAVLVKNTTAPLERTLLLYGGPVSEYHYTATVDTNDARVVFGDFDGDNTSADVAVIDEQSITTFLNVGGSRPQQKSQTGVPVQGFPLTSRLLCRTAGFRMKFQ